MAAHPLKQKKKGQVHARIQNFFQEGGARDIRVQFSVWDCPDPHQPPPPGIDPRTGGGGVDV